MVEPPESFIKYAINKACQSPCRKSKRGAMLFLGNEILGGNFNGPPIGWDCIDDDACKTLCGRRCMHAEERVLLQSDPYTRFSQCDMLHVKAVDGALVPSGPPSCWQCSRTIQDLELGGMWLYHKDGWRRYGAEEFNRLTLENCGMLLKTPFR